MITNNTTWRRRWGLVLVAVAIAVTASTVGPGRAFAAAGVTAEDVQLGQRTTITVTGCNPAIEKSVSLSITDSAGKEVDSGFLTENTALWEPRDIGEYTVSVTCKGTGGTPDSTATTTFSATMVPIAVTPASFEAGSEVELRAEGYKPGERLRVSLNQCEVATRCYSVGGYRSWDVVEADSAGKLAYRVQVPTSLPPGDWTFSVSNFSFDLLRWSPIVTTTAQPTALDVYPAAWGAGSQVHLLASGFKPGEAVKLRLVGPDAARDQRDLGEQQAGDNGVLDSLNATSGVVIPEDLTPGKWTIIAVGSTSGSQRSSAQVDTSKNMLEVSPANWTAGTKVSLKADGFAPGESVEVEFYGYVPCPSGGDGGVGTQCPPSGRYRTWPTTADASGAINLSVEVPGGAGGQWNFRAQGQASRVTRVSALKNLPWPKLEASPAKWKAGSSVTLRATRLAAGESVTLNLVGTKACAKGAVCGQITLKTWTSAGAADKSGDWTYQVQVPKDLPPGTWAFVVVGATSRAEIASGSVIISAKLPPTGD